MKTKKRNKGTITIRPRFRILCGDDIALGPGKVELLAGIKQTGSILKAAKQLDMSYMRAWTLLKTMERCFKERLITTERGGNAGGGAMLTPTGEAALELYLEMERISLESTETQRKQIETLLR